LRVVVVTGVIHGVDLVVGMEAAVAAVVVAEDDDDDDMAVVTMAGAVAAEVA
jgi:hypothetical protein